jgi:hypothetical protein
MNCVKQSLADWLTNRRDELDFEWSIYGHLKRGVSNYKRGDGGEIDVKYDKVISEGEAELGFKLAGRGDVSFPRQPVTESIALGMQRCLEHESEMVKEIEQAFQEEGANSCNGKEQEETLKRQEEFERSQREALEERMKRDKEEKEKGGIWSRMFGSSEDSDRNKADSDVGYFGIDGMVLGSAAPTPAPVLPQLLTHSKVWASCVANHGISPDFSSVSQEVRMFTLLIFIFSCSVKFLSFFFCHAPTPLCVIRSAECAMLRVRSLKPYEMRLVWTIQWEL